jgi:hypothetical protein
MVQSMVLLTTMWRGSNGTQNDTGDIPCIQEFLCGSSDVHVLLATYVASQSSASTHPGHAANHSAS